MCQLKKLHFYRKKSVPQIVVFGSSMFSKMKIPVCNFFVFIFGGAWCFPDANHCMSLVLHFFFVAAGFVSHFILLRLPKKETATEFLFRTWFTDLRGEGGAVLGVLLRRKGQKRNAAPGLKPDSSRSASKGVHSDFHKPNLDLLQSSGGGATANP